MLTAAVGALAQVDVMVAAAVAAVFAAWGGRARHRRAANAIRRMMDSALSALLFFVLGMRSAIYAVCVIALPSAVLVTDTLPVLPLALFFGYAVLAALGIALHRGPVAGRVAGAVILSLQLIGEVILAFTVVPAPPLMQADTFVGLAIAGAVLYLALLHWSHRSAAPNPLGGLSQPLDY